jgi:plasmid stabilization system protein ParE
MKNRFSVKWTFSAEDDLLRIVEYILEKSPGNANLAFQKIKDSASQLTNFPERGRIVPEIESQGIFLFREIVVAPWRIIYRVSKESVFVLAVIDSRQNVEDVLLNRIFREPRKEEVS